jgi:cellobiose phosphorylase
VVKQFRTKYGHFAKDGCEYIITRPDTPRPWVNVISNGDYGLVISQTGSGYSWRTHAQLNRVTRWEQDLIRDDWGKYVYLRDERGHLWSASWKPVCQEPDVYRCRHGIGYTIIESSNFGIETEWLIFVSNDEPLEIWKLTVHNTTRRARIITLTTYLEWGLGAAPDWHREFHKSFIMTSYDADANALIATKRLWEVPTERGHWNTDWPYTAFHSCSEHPTSYDGDKESFLGRYGTIRNPASLQGESLKKRTGNWLDPIASLAVNVSLRPGQEKTVCFTLGVADSGSHATALATKYHALTEVDQALKQVKHRWDELLGTVEVETPDEAMDTMENIWLKYQAISGRLWGRTAYYQTGGAYGFRDQLQDSQIFLPIDANQTKKQILLHARHQFKDGTVYHWWHPLSEIGLQNQITDNLLWLPFVVNSYIQETGDLAILSQKEPFVDDANGSSLYEHCVRAIEKVLVRMSERGLPLIGAGDWNDGLSAVGLDMKGESIWLAHFLHRILIDFADLSDRHGTKVKAREYRARAERLRGAINAHGWDGEWYYRATKDSGEKLGSKENTEGKVFLNAQTWAVIAGVADEQRAEQVMNVVEKSLEFKAGPVLLYPAYSTPDKYIGYLTRYSPGMRENGGVYTHAATWAVIAEAMLGRGESAYRIYSKLNPVNRGQQPDEYYAEPYVTAGNIEGPDSPYYGRGGWTWYTGSAAWLFKAGLEWILGIRPTIDGLVIDPCIPSKWTSFKVRRIFRGVTYTIEVRNPQHVRSGISSVQIDDKKYRVEGIGRTPLLPVLSPGSSHTVVVVLGYPGSEG